MVVWVAYWVPELPPRAARWTRSRDLNVSLSLVSLQKLTINAVIGWNEFVDDLAHLHGALVDEGIRDLPITVRYLARAATLPWLRRDPFDHLLVAQTWVESPMLQTADMAFKVLGPFRALAMNAARAAYFGAIRIAPSSRITSPLSMSLVMIWCTSLA
jgi:PIN domain nuclease of toxin-antitoxin system